MVIFIDGHWGVGREADTEALEMRLRLEADRIMYKGNIFPRD